MRAHDVADRQRAVPAVDHPVRLEQVDVPLERPREAHVRGDPQAARAVRRSGPLDRRVGAVEREAEERGFRPAAGQLSGRDVRRPEHRDDAAGDRCEPACLDAHSPAPSPGCRERLYAKSIWRSSASCNTVDGGMARRSTIHDVAAAVGLSPTTVSHALNGKGRVDPATRERVARAADRLGYRAQPHRPPPAVGPQRDDRPAAAVRRAGHRPGRDARARTTCTSRERPRERRSPPATRCCSPRRCAPPTTCTTSASTAAWSATRRATTRAWGCSTTSTSRS